MHTSKLRNIKNGKVVGLKWKKVKKQEGSLQVPSSCFFTFFHFNLFHF